MRSSRKKRYTVKAMDADVIVRIGSQDFWMTINGLTSSHVDVLGLKAAVSKMTYETKWEIKYITHT